MKYFTPFLIACLFMILADVRAQTTGTIKIKKAQKDSVMTSLDTIANDKGHVLVSPTFYYGYHISDGLKDFSNEIAYGNKFLPERIPEIGGDLSYATVVMNAMRQYASTASVLGFDLLQKQHVDIGDSLHYDLSGYRGHVFSIFFKPLGGRRISFNNTRKVIQDPHAIELMFGPGFEFGRIKLVEKDLKSGTSVTFTNPFFALHIMGEIKFNLYIGNWHYISFGVRSGYLKDIGHVGWKTKSSGNFSIPGVDQTGYYYQGFLGISL